MGMIRTAVAITILMTLLTGIAYPLAVTGIAQVIFPREAKGSLIERDGKTVGANLIGQSFTSDRYFHGRPSATTAADPNDASKTIPSPYNAANSGGSNLGPTNKSFIDGIKAAADRLHTENGSSPIPVDLVTASGSGLDPHITPAAARFQIARVAKARNLSEIEVAKLVDDNSRLRFLGLLGEARVNVLRLNLVLDELEKSEKQ